MLLKKNYLLFLLLIFIILIDKNVFAAPLCFEEEDSVENKKFTINENSLEKNNDSNRNNDLEKTNNKNKDEERKDIEISADNKIEVDNEQGVMIVTGNAYVKEGLTSLQADILTAFNCETKKG